MKIESDLAAKICEKLPFDLTIYNKDGRCVLINPNCVYVSPHPNPDLQICRKKTATTIPIQELTN